ncbi:uncharacterized protein TNCT_72751 [Trichonephila clavata]|uniref:Gustatory receptor n=1 Tax=Trichonephila clavata TaxID=2740835 RepID=A0A8X6FNU0_TRICU|nr:uncharacterized protein TNCT_72751 [Trichonephila clavata]
MTNSPGKETWLYVIRSFFGIKGHNPPHKTRSYFKNIFSFTNIFVHISFLYSGSLLLFTSGNFALKRSVTDLSCLILPVVIFHLIRMQSGKMCVFYMYLKNVLPKFTKFSCREKRIINATVLVTFLFPATVALAMIAALISNYSKPYIRFWLFGHDLAERQIAETLLCFICMMVYFFAKFLVPSLATLVYGIITYKFSQAIHIQNEVMKKNVFSKTFSFQVKVYYRLLEGCRLFEDCSKATMLFLILCYCNTFYTGIGIALREQTSTPNVAIYTESVFTLIPCIFIIVILLIIASRITAKTSETRLTFQQLYRNNIVDGGSISTQQIKLIKVLMQQEPFYLTAWDFFRVDKGLILSLFGTVLTFCILIMQLKKVDLDSLK